MTHIDVLSALTESVKGNYSDLVTRRTGMLVRHVIENRLAGLQDGTVAFLDFSHIGVLDRSCADEILSKLMLPLTSEHAPRDGYVVLHGISEDHLETIEAVLLTHQLALVVQLPDQEARLVGAVTDLERQCWELVMRHGEVFAPTAADELGMLSGPCLELLESLARRRLLRRVEDCFSPLGAAA